MLAELALARLRTGLEAREGGVNQYSEDDILSTIEVYERETRKVVERFLSHRLSFPDCIAALNAALADLIPRLSGEQIPRLRIVMLANNETVLKEMERRGPSLRDFRATLRSHQRAAVKY